MASYTVTVPIKVAAEFGLMLGSFKPFTVNGNEVIYKFRYRNKQVQFACELANLVLLKANKNPLFIRYQ